jgi:hypothetical protein
MRLRKGQTAMEYLMTYGWAILVVMVVLAALFYLGILNPRGITPNQCSFPAGFSCIAWKLYTNGTLYLKLGQGMGRTINITGLNCTTNVNVIQQGGTIRFSSGGYAMQSASYLSGQVNCTNNTNGIVGITGSPSDVYNGKIYINYTETETKIQRLVVGSISTKYEV